MTVHVFSDDDAVRDSLHMLLEAKGVAIRTYSSFDVLMREVAPERSSCVLLDVSAGRPDLLELLRQLPTRGPSVPVLVLASDRPAIQAQESDIIILRKPVEPEALVAAVRKVCHKRVTETT